MLRRTCIQTSRCEPQSSRAEGLYRSIRSLGAIGACRGPVFCSASLILEVRSLSQASHFDGTVGPHVCPNAHKIMAVPCLDPFVCKQISLLSRNHSASPVIVCLPLALSLSERLGGGFCTGDGTFCQALSHACLPAWPGGTPPLNDLWGQAKADELARVF